MSDPWSALQGAGLGALALGVLGALVKLLWAQREKVAEKAEHQREQREASHETRIAMMEKQLISFTTQFAEQQKDFGKLEAEHGRLADKLDGLQKFWREEFEKLSDKMTGSMDRLHTAIRKDFEEHRQLVHDRMGQAARDMVATVEQVGEALLKKKRGSK